MGISDTDIFIPFFGYDEGDKEEKNCSYKDCLKNLKKVEYVAQALNDVMRFRDLPFGSFLASSLPQLYFAFCEDCKVRTQFVTDHCYMYEEVSFAHQFLANLSIHFGFDEKEAVSLFDIPSILANTITPIANNFKLAQAYVHSTCKNNFSVKRHGVCHSVWHKYIKNSEGTIT